MFANLTREVNKLLSNLSSIILSAVSESTAVVSDSAVSSADAAGKSVLDTMPRSELMVVVTITGIVVVFSMLVLLTLLFAFYGKIADGISGRAKKKSGEKIKNAAPTPKAAPAAAKKTSSAQSVKTASAPVSDGSIPEEIIAVIAAAVASMSDGTTGYQIRSVRRASRQGASAWRQAALAENTRRF